MERPKRPGGPLQGRPSEGLDKKWRDKFGELLTPEKAWDMEYAARFWQHQPEGMREAMMSNIESAAKQNPPQIGYFVDPSGITEKDKERLSAYRVLAEEMGYEVGQYVFNKQSHAALAPIHKKL